MKRDMETVREILKEVEIAAPRQYGDPEKVHHIAIMEEAGLLNATIITNGTGIPSQAVVLRLTWHGHDFLDASRNDVVWKKVMGKIVKTGASFTFAIVSELLKKEIGHKLGLTP